MNENDKTPDLVDNDETLWIGAAVAAVLFTVALVIDVPILLAILIGLILVAVLAYILHIRLGFELPALGKGTASAAPAPGRAAAVEPKGAVKPTPELTGEPASEAVAPEPAPKVADVPAAKPAATPQAANRPAVQPSTPLPGEADLASRKGEWRYQVPAAAPAPGEGIRPQGLSAARNDAPDDLKRIKGVGPKLEQMLHDLGYYHFDQIAAWNLAEVAWVDDNLEGFKGRVSRDEWVAQARELASGD